MTATAAEAQPGGDGLGPTLPANPEGAPGWTHTLLGLAFPGIFLLYLAQTIAGVHANSEGVWSIVGYVSVVAFGVCYLLALTFWQGSDHCVTSSMKVAGLAMVALTVIAAVPAHEDVWVMFVFLAAIAIAVYGGRGLLVAGALTVVAVFLPPAIPSWHAGIQVDAAITIPLISLALFSFFAVMHANTELTEARGEIARLAAEGERSRIARDLHDLLGHSLTAITVKATLARRLATSDPGAAATEIGEVESLARGALADVRAAVGGYRDVTLATELATGREVLRAAGVEADFPGAVTTVDPANRELFGWVVRECVTNVVRHARATRCTITVSQSELCVTDDGVGSDAAEGNGLSGLRARVAEAGGKLQAGPAPAGGYRVSVKVPAPGELPEPGIEDDTTGHGPTGDDVTPRDVSDGGAAVGDSTAGDSSDRRSTADATARDVSAGDESAGATTATSRVL